MNGRAQPSPPPTAPPGGPSSLSRYAGRGPGRGSAGIKNISRIEDPLPHPPPAYRERKQFRRRGVVVIYASVFFVAIIAVVSLAVDWGRVQMVKTELQDAADAAARYAVTGIRDNTALARAQAVALQNKADGTALVLTSADVEVGTWSDTTRVFTVGGSNQNAVRVTARRTTARGNPVPLVFAKAIGRSTCDVTAVSVANQDVLPYSMVALNGVTMSGVSTIQRKATEALGGNSVIVASNGAWSLGTTSIIAGDTLYRTTAPGGGIISGTKTAMSTDIVYSVVATPGGTSPLGAVSYTSGTMSNISGAYNCTTVNLGGTFNFSLNGDLTLYCSGNVAFGGNCNVVTNGYKFTIYMTNASTITFTNNLPVNVVVYGPTSPMTVNALGKITGSFVAKSLTMTTGTIEYTSALPIPVASSGGAGATVTGGVSTVK